MPQLKYSARASKDLIRLFNFLAEKDERLAQGALLVVRDAFTPLMHMPKMGRPVAGGLREQIIAFGRSGYVALHDFDEVRDVVVVLAVRHQREVDYKS